MNKRLLALVLAVLAALLGMAGCKARSQSDDPFKGMTLEGILDRLYAAADVELPSLNTTQINAENEAYYFGDADIPYTEAIASEPLMSAIAYSVCLLRIEDRGENANVQQALKESVNPAKWICVCVDEQNVVTDGRGDVVILIMSDQSDALHAAFLKIAEYGNGRSMSARIALPTAPLAVQARHGYPSNNSAI